MAGGGSEIGSDNFLVVQTLWCLQKIEVYLQGLDIFNFCCQRRLYATQPPQSWKGTLQVKLIPGFSRDSTKQGGTAAFPGKGSIMASKRVGLGSRSPGGSLGKEPKARPTACSSCVVGTLETMAKVDCSANILLKSSWLRCAKRANSWAKVDLVEVPLTAPRKEKCPIHCQKNCS